MKKILSVILSAVLLIGICPQISAEVTLPDSLGTDYEAGEVTGNKYDVANEAIGTTLLSNSSKVGFSADLNGDMVFSSNQVIGDGIEAINANQAIGAQVATAYVDWTDLHVNGKTFIVGAQVKKLEGSPRITAGFTEAPTSGDPNRIGDRANGYEVYEGFEITSTEYAPVCLTMTMTKARSNMDNTTFAIGFPEDPAGTTSVEPRSFAMKPGSLFIGFEAAHDIEVSTVGTAIVTPETGGTINVIAKILNQVGTTGGLEQGTFSWYALNDDRTDFVDGISVVAKENGTATVIVNETVPVGTYTIVAKSENYEGFVESTKIVIGYDDYLPREMPENLLGEGITAADLLYMNYNNHIKLTSESSVSMDVYVNKKEDGSVLLTAERDLDSPYAVYEDTDDDGYKDTLVEGAGKYVWAFSGAGIDEDVLHLPDENSALVFSFKVSNNDTTYLPKINFGRNESPLLPNEYSATDKGMEVVANDGKWQVFSGTIPADSNYGLDNYSYSIGLSEGTAKGTSVVIKADDIYFGVEKAYDIVNSVVGSDSVYVGVGGTITVDADIINQIYSTGDLEQGEFNWYALNEERTETIEGIKVTAGENGTATVSIDATVPCGAYDIVASSKLYPGFVKGVKVYVVLPEDTNADGMSQHIARDFEELRTLTFLLNQIKHTNSTLSYETSSGPEKNSKVLTVKPSSAGGMALFDIRTEAGNKYKISAWVRADSNADNGYFVFTNKAIDGGSDVINEVPVNKSFTAGEWVYVTAEYTADGRGLRSGERVGALLSGTVGFRFGSGSTVSYAIDELFIFPEVDNKLDYDDVFTQGSFDTNACLNEWTVWANEGGSLTTEQKKTNGFSYDGYRNKPGALELDGIKMFDSIHPSETVDIVYGRAYRMSFYAKALDDEAVGQPIWFYLGYSDKSGDGFDPVFNKFYHVNNGQNPTLTKEWQYFEIDFDYDFVGRNLAEMTMGFRVSDLQNSFLTRGGRPHYMIDEVSLKQIGGEDFVVDADTYGDVTSTEGATIKLNYVESTKGKFLYRIVRETSNGDYCIEQGFTEDEVLDFAHTEDLGEDKLRLDLVGTDAYGNYSQLYTMPIEAMQKSDKVTLIPDNYIWNDDINTLSATMTYENNTSLKDLNVYAALYTADDRLVALKKAEFSTMLGEKKELSVSMDIPESDDVKHAAVKAKFFAWYNDSYAPATCVDEICKTIGEFIYVDVNSAATEENGSYQEPYKTIQNAVSKLENIVMTTEKENIYVVLKSGEYIQSKTIDLSNAASMSNKNIVFTTLDGDKATISGASRITGFTEYKNGIYRASVPSGINSRQLYVNGIKATRARSVEDVEGFKNLDTTDSSKFANKGLSCTDTSYVHYAYPKELELVFIENWCHYYIMPDSIAESDGKALFTFTDEGNAATWKRLMTERVLAPTVPVYLENALELLDEPGEWYLDTHENYLYYMPRNFENIDTAEVILPVTEQLVKAEGTADNPVKNISFKNIDFCYSAWNYPTTNRSFLPTQALYYQNLNKNSWDGGEEIVDGALQFKNVHNITFDNCDFTHLGSNGLVLIGAVQNAQIVGNEFYEISGNAINLGEVEKGENFNPQEEKYFVTDNEISNNYIHKIGDDYYSSAGLVVGYPKNTVIKNNEITDAPYCGIHAGWGWASSSSGGIENLVIENNYIHNTMNWRLYDGAPIYVVGMTNGTNDNPNLIRANYIADTKNPESGIYPDDGSTYWKVSENVIDASMYPIQHYLKESQIGYASWLNVWTPRVVGIVAENNYSTTSHYRYEGTAGSIEQADVFPNAGWNDEALAIINNAGIKDKYSERFDFDIQMLTLPTKVTLSKNETAKLYYDAKSTKNSYCDMSDCEISVKSSNEEVATATINTITGVSAGKSWITFSVSKKNTNGNLLYYDEHRFCVVVE